MCLLCLFFKPQSIHNKHNSSDDNNNTNTNININTLYSISLSDNPANKDIRLLQSQYISKVIELNNKEFQAPVVMGISMNDSPSSPVLLCVLLT